MVKYQTFDELANTAMGYLSSLSYSLKTIDLYQREWRGVGNYMKQKGIKEYNAGVGNQYLIETITDANVASLPRGKRMRIRAISSLSDFLMTGSIRKRKLKTQPEELDGEIGIVISRYIIEAAQANNYAKRTIQSHRLYLSRFLNYLNERNITSFASFSPGLMINFAQSLKDYSIITRHFIILKTNQFLRHLYEQEILPVDYSATAPKDKYVRQPKLPSYFSTEEIRRLLNCIDRSNANGKRDYAMILLAVRLGLRRSDIVNMQFCNIYWEREKILFNQQKTKVAIELPLFQDVGNAIIDHLKYGRPQSDLPYVFLRLVPPYDNLDENALNGMLEKYLRIAGIKYDERRHGPHALRHSLATNLLKQKTSLPVISSVLGHLNTETTIDYLRIDITSLRQCTLEVPYINQI